MSSYYTLVFHAFKLYFEIENDLRSIVGKIEARGLEIIKVSMGLTYFVIFVFLLSKLLN